MDYKLVNFNLTQKIGWSKIISKLRWKLINHKIYLSSIIQLDY